MLRSLLFSCLLLVTLSLAGQSVVSLTLQESFSRAELAAQLPGVAITFGTELYALQYTTTDPFGVPDTASGLVVLPVPDPGRTLTSVPVAVYNHGTVDNREAVPSRPGVEERLLPTAFAAFGYVVLAPDYLGLGESRGFHPYVHAETEARAGLDMLRALREYATAEDYPLNDQLFITGYSQGGHASMALHQAIETEFSAEFSVTAAVHMSGPYSISGAMVDRILSEEPYLYPAYLVNTFLSYNYVDQLYDSIVAVFKPEYAPLAESFLAEEITLGTLNDTLVTLLETEYGSSQTHRLLQDSIVMILEDSAANADHPIWVAIRENDVYEWAPVAPTRLIYCSGDEQVAFQNALLADSVMNQLGAIDVESRNILPGGSHGQCIFPAALFMIDFFNTFRSTTVPTTTLEPAPTLTIYPNPVFTREISITGIDNGDWQAHLFDAAGRLVEQSVLPAGERRLPVGHLPQGVYWLRLTNGRTVLTEKVFVGI
jgi:acetyl esterase/lipase